MDDEDNSQYSSFRAINKVALPAIVLNGVTAAAAAAVLCPRVSCAGSAFRGRPLPNRSPYSRSRRAGHHRMPGGAPRTLCLH
jgi:hypothetical protein